MSVTLSSFYRGDDHMLRVTITGINPDTGEKEAVDITGWRFFCSLKLSTEEPDANAPVMIDTGELSGQDAEQGRVYIHLPSSQTRNLLPTTYWVDIQRVLNGVVTTILVGKIKVLPDVTRSTGDE